MTGVEIGTAIVSYIEPEPGYARAFNEWYERDHFPATVLAGPGVFGGARFVATRACKAARPSTATLFGDPARGSYLALAWMLPGRLAEWQAWVAHEMEAIVAAGRMFAHREHIQTGAYGFLSATGDIPAPMTLAHGFGGVVATAGVSGVPAPAAPAVVRLALEHTILSSCDAPPHELALAFCADPIAAVRSADLTGAGFVSPFVATIPGTDTYTEEC